MLVDGDVHQLLMLKEYMNAEEYAAILELLSVIAKNRR